MILPKMLLSEGVLIRWCDKCQRKSSIIIVKNKRHQTRVYCLECNSMLRNADKADKEDLKVYAK